MDGAPAILLTLPDLGPGSWGPSVVGWGKVGFRVDGLTAGPGRRGEKAGEEGDKEGVREGGGRQGGG